jgi:hypothetical protein
VAELLARTGGYVEAFLGLEQRTAKRDGQTRHWMVPTIDVAVTPAALMADAASVGSAVAAGPERAAITGGRPDYAALAAVATTADEVAALYKQAVAAKHMDKDLAAVLGARGTELRRIEEVADEAGESGWKAEPHQDGPFPDEDGAVDAEVVDDGDLAEIWFQIIAAAGTKGWTTDETEQRFAARNGGLMPATASAEQLSEFLTAVKAGEIA